MQSSSQECIAGLLILLLLLAFSLISICVRNVPPPKQIATVIPKTNSRSVQAATKKALQNPSFLNMSVPQNWRYFLNLSSSPPPVAAARSKPADPGVLNPYGSNQNGRCRHERLLVHQWHRGAAEKCDMINIWSAPVSRWVAADDLIVYACLLQIIKSQ